MLNKSPGKQTAVSNCGSANDRKRNCVIVANGKIHCRIFNGFLQVFKVQYSIVFGELTRLRAENRLNSGI